jgi:hypothetical protein
MSRINFIPVYSRGIHWVPFDMILGRVCLEQMCVCVCVTSVTCSQMWLWKENVLKSSVFWHTTPCSQLKVGRRFGGICGIETNRTRAVQPVACRYPNFSAVLCFNILCRIMSFSALFLSHIFFSVVFFPFPLISHNLSCYELLSISSLLSGYVCGLYNYKGRSQ